MSWIGPRTRRQIAVETAQAMRFTRRHHGAWLTPRRSRIDWLYGRFSLLPDHVDLVTAPIWDVGANAGDWTAALLRLSPRSRAVLFEPNPAMAEGLRQRFAHAPNVDVRELAASDCRAHLTLHLTAHSHNSSLRTPRDMNAEYGVTTGWEEIGTVEVEAIPLDELLVDMPPPSLLKIDVQGAELSVLAGAHRLLGQAQAVLLEVTERSHYLGDALSDDLHDVMVEQGYALVGKSDPWLDARTGAPLWYDACYVRSG